MNGMTERRRPPIGGRRCAGLETGRVQRVDQGRSSSGRKGDELSPAEEQARCGYRGQRDKSDSNGSDRHLPTRRWTRSHSSFYAVQYMDHRKGLSGHMMRGVTVQYLSGWSCAT